MIKQKRYTDGFKSMVLEEIKAGKWSSVQRAADEYNISRQTVAHWLEVAGLEHLQNRSVIVKTKNEATEIQRLKAEVKYLKELLLDTTIESKINEVTLRLMCEKANTTPEEVKKKAGTMLPRLR